MERRGRRWTRGCGWAGVLLPLAAGFRGEYWLALPLLCGGLRLLGTSFLSHHQHLVARRPHRNVAARRAYVERDASMLKESMQLLGVQPGASLADVRAAYRAKAKQCHPDISEKLGVDPDEAAEKFIAVQSAYNQLISMTNEDDDLALDMYGWSGQFAWELSWMEVVTVAQAQEQVLRDMVWFSLALGEKKWGWQMEGARRDKIGLPPRVAGRAVLMQALLPLLDEVTRRDLRIYRAKMLGDDEEVVSLRKERTERHNVYHEWLKIRQEMGSDSAQAAELLKKFDMLTKFTGDVTKEEGSYPEEIDADIARKLAAPRMSLPEGREKSILQQ